MILSQSSLKFSCLAPLNTSLYEKRPFVELLLHNTEFTYYVVRTVSKRTKRDVLAKLPMIGTGTPSDFYIITSGYGPRFAHPYL